MKEKMTLSQLSENENWKRAVVVFTEDSFNKHYDLTSRSYEISRDNKYFKPYCIGNSLYGYCLDGKDNGVRLDWYMWENWKVDYCYIIE